MATGEISNIEEQQPLLQSNKGGAMPQTENKSEGGKSKATESTMSPFCNATATSCNLGFHWFFFYSLCIATGQFFFKRTPKMKVYS